MPSYCRKRSAGQPTLQNKVTANHPLGSGPRTSFTDYSDPSAGLKRRRWQSQVESLRWALASQVLQRETASPLLGNSPPSTALPLTVASYLFAITIRSVVRLTAALGLRSRLIDTPTSRSHFQATSQLSTPLSHWKASSGLWNVLTFIPRFTATVSPNLRGSRNGSRRT